MKFFARFVCILIFLGAGLFANSFVDIKAVGYVKKAVGNVFVIQNNQTKTIKVGDNIFEKDILQTGKKSLAIIKMTDGTEFKIGSNSNLNIKKYIFDKTNRSKMIFASNKGSFDVKSGLISKVAKDNFQFNVNNVIVGIRGTHFNVDLTNDAFGCQQGAIILNAKNQKKIILQKNQMVFYNNSKFSNIKPFNSKKFGVLKEKWLNDNKFIKNHKN